MPKTRQHTTAWAIASALLWLLPTIAEASDCDDAASSWLACEDFEAGDLGWQQWFSQSPFVQCKGCSKGVNNPDRILLDGDSTNAHDGDWSVHLPGGAAADYQGAELVVRTCEGEKQEGCQLTGYDRLYFRTWVKLAEDHQYVHHFLSIGGSRADGYWDIEGNAGCRPNGVRSMGTTLDFTDHELWFYSYHPDMNCDAGGYCSGSYAQDICDGCAAKDMPCENGLECCWGNRFAPEPPVILPRGEWTCLEMMMDANTPGESDGKMAFWINDELGHEVDGMHWRDTADLQLNRANLGHYVEVGDATQSNRLWFDDMVVSTERIGCAGAPPGGGDTGDSTGDPPGSTNSAGGDAGADTGAGADDSGAEGGTVPTAGSGTSGATAGTPTNTGPGATDGNPTTATPGETDSASTGCGCRHRGAGFGWGWLVLLVAAATRRRPA